MINSYMACRGKCLSGLIWSKWAGWTLTFSATLLAVYNCPDLTNKTMPVDVGPLEKTKITLREPPLHSKCERLVVLYSIYIRDLTLKALALLRHVCAIACGLLPVKNSPPPISTVLIMALCSAVYSDFKLNL